MALEKLGKILLVCCGIFLLFGILYFLFYS